MLARLTSLTTIARVLQNQVGDASSDVLTYSYPRARNKAIIDAVDLDTPPWERESTGMWMDVPRPTLELMRNTGINAAEAIHAASHAFMNRFALAADLRTECKVAEKEYMVSVSQRKRPARYVPYVAPDRATAKLITQLDILRPYWYERWNCCQGVRPW